MAEKVTPKDFVRWTTEQIDPADISALMSDFGYTDDSQESIMDAIERHPNFRVKYGKLLRKSVAKRKAERNRSIGGVRMEDDSVTIDEWKEIVWQNSITKATGTNLNPKDENKKGFWDYFNVILGTAGSVASSIWGKPVDQQDQQQQPQQSGMNTFLVIIVIVVIIAVGAVIWASLSKK
jgi:hypothetical protein